MQQLRDHGTIDPRAFEHEIGCPGHDGCQGKLRLVDKKDRRGFNEKRLAELLANVLVVGDLDRMPESVFSLRRLSTDCCCL